MPTATITHVFALSAAELWQLIGEFYHSYSIVTSPLPVASYRATMSVAPPDEASCTFTWSGVFDAQGIKDADAVEFFEGVYRSGIAMVMKTVGLG